jgi:hypothetical protein
MQWNNPLILEMYGNGRNIDEATRLHDLDLQQERVFKHALIPCLTTHVLHQRMNTFNEHSRNWIKDQNTDVLTW